MQENLHFCSLLESVTAWRSVKEDQGALDNSYPAGSACRAPAQCWNPGQAMAAEVVPDVIPDLTLHAATHPAGQICFLGLAESRESLFCTMRHSKRIIMKG